MTTAPFPLLIEAALRAQVVALVVWAGLRLFRVRNVLAQKAAWALVLAAALAMPVLMRWQGPTAFAVIRVPQPFLRSAPESAAPAVSGALSAPTEAYSTSLLPKPSAAHPSFPQVGSRFPAPSISIGGSGVSSEVRSIQAQTERVPPQGLTAQQSVARSVSWQSAAGFLYLAVAAALMFRVVFGLGVALQLWAGAQPIFLEHHQNSFSGLHLRASPVIASPVTVGSAVLLPADYAQWDAEKLRVVLAHERSHIRQGDFYLQLLAALYAVLFWFSPLGWWLKIKLSNLGEAIGDHAALNEATSPASYAQLLLEFAALPRPTLIGVAMAHPSTISKRIERLLNDSTFRMAFAGSKSRALLAVLIVPVAIFAATAMLRVEAGSVAQTPAAPPAVPASSPAGPAAPTAPAAPSSSDAATILGEPPSPPAAPQAPLAAPGNADVLGSDSALAPAPPQAPPSPDVLILQDGHVSPEGHGHPFVLVLPDMHVKVDQALIRKQVQEQIAAAKLLQDARFFQLEGDDENHFGYYYNYSNDGESWAIVPGPGEKARFYGAWNGANAEQIEKARKMAHGKFLWFTRDGKSYIVEDPSVVAQIEAMDAPMEALGRQQAELGKKQGELGNLQEELGRQMGQMKFTAPDISKEMADLTAAMSKMQAEMGKEISREQLAELQGKLAQLQGKLGALYGRSSASTDELGAKMGKLGGEQGELGAQQGKLGAEQGKLAREADQKVKAMTDESLKNGKAKPVR